MSGSWAGELVWVKRGSAVVLCVLAPKKVFDTVGKGSADVKVSNLRVPLVRSVPGKWILYRHRIGLTRDENGWAAGPVYAILAGAGNSSFIGAKSNFRDIMKTARVRGTFVYVVPADGVRRDGLWNGFVRVGYRRWIALPCPRPEAIYNRIPNRNLERSAPATTAKQVITALGIPMFNPDYFNKATIYQVIRNANLQQYLPETSDILAAGPLLRMLDRNHAVYLKPTGGSIGHGMIRIEKRPANYVVQVLKNSRCTSFVAKDERQLWSVVSRERLPGKYVIQSAIPLLTWNGLPCDFRVLLQKRGNRWVVTGKGVRVAGVNSITTHVPNGGSIADAHKVLSDRFGDNDAEVNSAIDAMVRRCAEAIDEYYRHQLGEMSMDVGVDMNGHPWFFEANAKPMKFDEPDIRQRSLNGVLARLDELRGQKGTGKMIKRK